jgi:hypothetical protein
MAKCRPVASLLRSREALFVPELISLTVLGGEVQEIESTVLVHLKLDKSLCHVNLLDNGASAAPYEFAPLHCSTNHFVLIGASHM